MEEKIYIVMPILLKEKTKEDLEKEYRHFLFKLNLKEEEHSFEKFISKNLSKGEKKFYINSFISSYHLTLEKAKLYAQQNVGDINEAGCYNYVCVCTADTDCTYYNTYQNLNEDFIVYKFDFVTDEYVPVEETEENKEILTVIKYHAWGMYY